MASSASLASPPPKLSNSDVDEESEYEEIEEEIEVEEEVEIEVEEEVEEEVDMEVETDDESEADPVKAKAGNEIGEALTPVRGVNRENETDRITELKEHEDVAHGVKVSNPQMDLYTMQKNVGDEPSKLSNNKELHAIAAEKTSRDNNAKVPFNNSMTPRFHLPQMRSRDPSSSEVFNGANKKLRMACEFHAKGWCIRGSSCMFLHVKDGSGTSDLSSRDVPFSHPAQPSYSGSSSWNPNAHRHPNFWESELERRAFVPHSFQWGIPPLSHSVSETPSLNHRFRDTGLPIYIPTFSPWEPSVPFIPLHEITRNLVLKEKLYEPVRDSMVEKDDPVSDRMDEKDDPVIDSTDEKDDPVRDSMDEKDDHVCDNMDEKDEKKKDSHSDHGSSVKDIHVQSNILKEEEKVLKSAHAGNTKEDNVLISSSDDKLKFDKTRDTTVSEVGGDEVVLNSKLDSKIQYESNEIKIFQFALIEFVKEIIKPTWREGFLSRDAHKLIVKKAVDKILISISPEQIPKTSEAADFYLASSQPKIAKLVEAYISKYGTAQRS